MFWPILLLLVMGIAWGLQFASLKMAVENGVNEMGALMLALVLISVVYGAFIVTRRRNFAIDRERLRFFVVVALIGYILPMGATLYAAPYITAGVLTLMASLAPLFTFAVAISLRTEPVSGRRVVAMVLGVIAVLVVLLPETRLPGFGTLPWLLLALIIPFCYGVESIYVSVKWPEGLDVLQVGFGEAFFAAILTVPLLFVYGEPSHVIPQWNAGYLGVLIFVLVSLLEVFIYFYLVRTTGGVLVSFATFISLFAGIAWGILIFSESHSAWVWLGVAILTLSLVFVTVDRILAGDTTHSKKPPVPG